MRRHWFEVIGSGIKGGLGKALSSRIKGGSGTHFLKGLGLKPWSHLNNVCYKRGVRIQARDIILEDGVRLDSYSMAGKDTTGWVTCIINFLLVLNIKLPQLEGEFHKSWGKTANAITIIKGKADLYFRCENWNKLGLFHRSQLLFLAVPKFLQADITSRGKLFDN